MDSNRFSPSRPMTTRIQMKQNGEIGTVVAVRGSVIDVHFADGLPHIDTLLCAGSHGEIAQESQLWAEFEALASQHR